MAISRARARADHAFALTELMVVLTVIAVLVALAVPTFLAQRDRALGAVAASDLRQAVVAMDAYAADNGGYPTRADTPSGWSNAVEVFGSEGFTPSGFGDITVVVLTDDGASGHSVDAEIHTEGVHYCIVSVIGTPDFPGGNMEISAIAGSRTSGISMVRDPDDPDTQATYDTCRNGPS